MKELLRLTKLFLNRKIKTFSSFFYSLFGLIDYHFNPKALKQSKIELFINYKRIRREFIESGFKVIDYKINKDDFKNWLAKINFPQKYINSYGRVFREKALEHYLSSKLLDLNKNDTYVDVAAAGSPFYDLAEKKYKCRSFAVDFSFPQKDDPRLVECDATKMPFADKSISKIALHCAFEMFENEADMDLIKEANRVLRPGGKMIIIPLYMAHFYFIMSSPKANRKGIKYGRAKRAWYDDRWLIRFARTYSVGAFKERIVRRLDRLGLKIYYFTNEKEMNQDPKDRIYVKFAACFTKRK